MQIYLHVLCDVSWFMVREFPNYSLWLMLLQDNIIHIYIRLTETELDDSVSSKINNESSSWWIKYLYKEIYKYYEVHIYKYIQYNPVIN